MSEYEKFWDEISQVEEVDYDDERINRLLRFKAIQSHLGGVRKILDVGAATAHFLFLWHGWALMLFIWIYLMK